MRVLIVDDDAEIRGLLRSTLAQEGIEADTAENGLDALELLNANRYAVMLMDLMMPAMNGFQLLEAVRKDSPVVLVVTGADQSMVNELDARLVHGIIRKPFDPRDVATLVRACVEIRGRGPLGAMAIASMIAGGPLIAMLAKM